MFFEVSPARNCTEKKPKQIVENQDDVLILAPFTANPKIFFENVAVGKSCSQKLLIRNPTKNDIDLFISRLLPQELSVEFSWTKTHIPTCGEVSLELKWLPQCSGSWRYGFTLEDGSKLKRDIPVILKSISPKKSKKCPAKKQTKPTFLVKKTKSPISRQMKSPNKRPALPNITNVPSITVNPPLSSSFGKENTSQNVSGFIFNKLMSPDVPDRRETYILKGPTMCKPLKNRDENFEDSLENNVVVDVTQSKFMDLKLQSLSFQFTPNTTPKNSTFQFRPDCCSTDEKSIETLSKTGKRVVLFNRENVTFEVNKSNHNISTETYVKGNASTETYVKGNLSTETYVKDLSLEAHNQKANISSSTYIKESTSVGDFASLQLSPVFLKPLSSSDHDDSSAKSVIEANLWAADNRTKPLLAIKEESYSSDCSITGSTNSRLLKKRKSDATFHITPPKRLKEPEVKEWAKSGGVAALRIAKRTSGLNLKTLSATSGRITMKDTSEVIFKDPFLLAATNKLDPFMTSTLYYSEEWIEEQAEGFKKWLNALLTPHQDLDSNEQSHPVDVARLWRECKKRNVALAPSKELVSERVNVNSRLNSLRRAAFRLYASKDMRTVLTKVCQSVDSDRLSIRKDRDVHLDLGLQSEIMSILLSYNPLWLRIGLETIYNQKLPLHSNSDLMGISAFLSERFFKSPFLLKKYKSVHTVKYSIELKKYLLKKFLTLVYFLDRAKESKLIPHDPCLFCQNAPVKESRDALLRLARETLSAVGDVTKYLKLLGYIVTHKQTYINEFVYAVDCLGVDLRDGVRLTRVMEIMLLRNDLTEKLRVPAISRLQKVHNLKIVFQALNDAGFEILAEISPKDIADGHREKTLSFLWQIIHKFQAPYLVKHAIVIQKWWRSDSMISKRSELKERREKMTSAALQIQSWYRKRLLLRKLEQWIPLAKTLIEDVRRDKAARKIQSWYRMHSVRTKYSKVRSTIIQIQSLARKWLISTKCKRRISSAIKIQSFVRMILVRKQYRTLKYSVLTIENHYESLKLMRDVKTRYDSLKASTILIQRWIRAINEMRKKSAEYRQLKVAVITIQRRFRALMAMRQQKRVFDSMKASVLMIEEWYFASKMMQMQMNRYVVLKYSAVTIQRRFRAKISMKLERSRFISLKSAAIVMQNRYRARLEMRKQVEKFRSLKAGCILVQRRFRAKLIGKSVRADYLRLKNAAVVIQRRYKAKLLGRIAKKDYEELKFATTLIQKRFRATLIMLKEKKNFEEMKSAAMKIQRRFRGLIKMRQDFNTFQKLKSATIVIQRRYRAQMAMRKDHANYEIYRRAVVSIQERFRAHKLMKSQSRSYNQLKSSALVLQKYWRAKKARDMERNRFLTLKKATIFIQTTFRAKRLSEEERSKFVHFKMCVVKIQQRFRANLQMRQEVANYKKIRSSIILIQNQYRAYKLMVKTRKIFSDQKEGAVKIQRWYRNVKVMQIQKKKYESLRYAAVKVQILYRAKLEMNRSRNEFLTLKNATITIQKRFRSLCQMKEERKKFLALKNSAITLQRRYRAQKFMKLQSRSYNQLKSSALVLQRYWRAKKARDIERNRFLTMKKAAIYIQTMYRAKKLSKKARTEFILLKMCVINIQQRFRAKLKMREELTRYQKIVKSVILIQEVYRAYRLMKETRHGYIERKLATVKIQQWYRNMKVMEIQRKKYEDLRSAVQTIQRRYRDKLATTRLRKEFLTLKTAAIIIQNHFRGFIVTKSERLKFLTLKNAAITLQQRYRAINSMKIQRDEYRQLKRVTIMIQRRYRAQLLMISQIKEYSRLKSSALVIQRYWRATKARDLERNQFLTLKKATIFVQNRFRNKIKSRQERTKFLRLKSSVIQIQQRFRANLLMREQVNEYRKIVACVIIIQRKYRAYKLMVATRKVYVERKEACLKIQRWYKQLQLSKRTRNDFVHFRKVVITMQWRYRASRLMVSSRNCYLRKKWAVLIIQRYFRCFLKMRTERNVYKLKMASILQIQRFSRGFLIRKRYAEFLSEEARKERKVKKILSGAAAKIQAAWKGYRSRSVDEPKLKEIRRKLSEATESAEPRKTLRYRCHQAIQLLSGENPTIVEIIDALEDIEFVTRRCKSTCFEMSGLLVEQLYLTIISSSRSLPEMNASTKAVEILINFCKYPPSKANSWCSQYMENIITVMLHWCDKETPLFPTLCTLLWLFAHVEEYKKQISSTPHFNQMLQKISVGVSRKQKMIERTRIKGTSLFIPARNRVEPSLNPDWGLEYVKNPRIFNNSVDAFNCLANILRN